MFARILWRLLGGSRGRLAVALVAVISGATVTSALINLDLDIDKKLSGEFRTLGANVVIAAKQAGAAADIGAGAESASLMDEGTVLSQVRRQQTTEVVAAAPYLYVVARTANTPIVVAGTWLDESPRLQPTWKISGEPVTSRADTERCLIGRNAAQQLRAGRGDALELSYMGRTARLTVAAIIDSGSAEDNQVFVNLPVAQRLAGLPGRIEFVQMSVNGTSDRVADYAAKLGAALPGEEVRPIRQVTEAEGRLLGRTRLLIVSMIVLILALTSLCVLATMAALATERREDVGLMKALGGSISKIVGLFLAEVGAVGAVGGIIGCVLGIVLSRWMGERVFATSITPRWEVFPLTVALTIGVAMAGALPLRLLGRVKPAVILRGE